MKKALKWIWWGTIKGLQLWVLLFVFLLLFVEGFDRYIATDFGGMRYMSKIVKDVKIETTADGLRYFDIGDKAKKPLLLVHGGFGGIWHWKGLLSETPVLEEFNVLVVERPGYGASGHKIKRDIIAEAELLLPIVTAQNQPVTVLGHSYGAAPALVLTAQNPQNVAHFIGVAGAYFTELEPTTPADWVSKVPIMGLFVPRVTWNALQENRHRRHNLPAVVGLYPSVSVPVTLLHGQIDSLIPTANTHQLAELMPEAKVLIAPNKDHQLQYYGNQWIYKALKGY